MSPVRSITYLAASGTSTVIPLERFLPVHSPGVFQAWLEQNIPRGSLVLDPFGSSPQMAIEAANSGYRVLVACNNPVTAFELRLLASSPNRSELSSVVSELAGQRKGTESLESVIRSLYLTRCASCGNEIQASAFLWHRAEPVPFARIYLCPHCGDAGEHAITDEDVQNLQAVQRSELMHRAMALERVIGRKSEGRENVEEALNVYLTRPLYVLFTLINKIEGMSLSGRQRELLEALLLPVLDAGNAIWSYPEEQLRPRQLSTPATFLENNLWLALENSVSFWESNLKPVQVTTWPEVPRDQGICLFPGRMRDLAQNIPEDIKPGGVICTFPRPNQAFWNLCALWASWIWGRDRAESFTSVMERRRFDWVWHTSALHSALAPAALVCTRGTPMFGTLPEPVPGLVNSVIESTSVCNYELQGYAFKNPQDAIQMEWKIGPTNREMKPVNMQKIAREGMREVLQEIGEPTEHIEIHTAAMSVLAQHNAFPPSIQLLTSEKAGEIQTILNQLKADENFLRRLDATSQEFESGLWWLAQPDSCQTPLADRVELELLSWLQKDGEISVADLRPRLYQRFPGALTPPDELILDCIESYATLDAQKQIWTIKDSERAGIREKEVLELQEQLIALARSMKLSCNHNSPMHWSLEPAGQQVLYRIYLSPTAVIDRDAFTQESEEYETIFILPGSRSGLLKFKIERDPYLRECITSRWHFLKFRTLRSIFNRQDHSLETWKALIDSDPLSLDDTTQLTMFH